MAALEGVAGLHISALGGYFGRLGLRQQAFILDDKEAGRSTYLEFRLLGLEAPVVTATSQGDEEGGVRGANIVQLAAGGKLVERKLAEIV